MNLLSTVLKTVHIVVMDFVNFLEVKMYSPVKWIVVLVEIKYAKMDWKILEFAPKIVDFVVMTFVMSTTEKILKHALLIVESLFVVMEDVHQKKMLGIAQ